MGKYSDFPSQTQNLQFNTPKRDDEHPRHFYMGLPSPGPHFLSLLLGVISSVNHNQLFLLTGDMMDQIF